MNMEELRQTIRNMATSRWIAEMTATGPIAPTEVFKYAVATVLSAMRMQIEGFAAERDRILPHLIAILCTSARLAGASADAVDAAIREAGEFLAQAGELPDAFATFAEAMNSGEVCTCERCVAAREVPVDPSRMPN